VCRHPGADRLHRQLLARDLAALEKKPADRYVRLAVAAVVADPHRPAAVEADQARALDLEKERVDRVVNPDQLEALPGERTVLDLGAAVPGAERLGRPPVERRLERAAAMPRAVQGNLEIAGEEALAAAVVAGEQRTEPGLEHLPRRRIVVRRQRRGGSA
jgi:hypothetical protein